MKKDNQKKFIEIRKSRKTLLDLDIGDLIKLIKVAEKSQEDKGLVVQVEKGGFGIDSLSDDESEKEMLKMGWPGYCIMIARRGPIESIMIERYESSNEGIRKSKVLNTRLTKRNYMSLEHSFGPEMSMTTNILYESLSHFGFNWIKMDALLKERGL